MSNEMREVNLGTVEQPEIILLPKQHLEDYTISPDGIVLPADEAQLYRRPLP